MSCDSGKSLGPSLRPRMRCYGRQRRVPALVTVGNSTGCDCEWSRVPPRYRPVFSFSARLVKERGTARFRSQDLLSGIVCFFPFGVYFLCATVVIPIEKGQILCM
jgi:hypothetical protein